MSTAYAQTCLENICTGDVVINRNDSVGVVVGIVDKQLIYRLGSNEYRAYPLELSKEIQDPNFTKGKVVINSNDSIGTVLFTFADKRIQYSLSGYKYVAKDLAYATSSYGDLVPGTEVINTNDSLGSVVQTFSDGRVQYSLSGYKYVAPAKNLSKIVETIDGLKAGAVVINSNDSIGTVKKVFANGRVQYTLSGYNYVTDSKSLSLENDGFGSIKSGAIALTSSDNLVKILKTFDNNKVQATNFDSYNYIFDLDSLSPEVPDHSTYNKQNTYAIDLHIGKVEFFFENGKVSLKSDKGSRRISKTLYAEVPSLGRLSEGNTVVTSLGTEVKILKLFENNTVQVEEKKVIEDQIVVEKKSARLILNASEMNQDEIVSYAYDIIKRINGELSYGFVSLVEEVPTIYKKLAENLNSIKGRFYTDKKTYKKFLEEIGASDSSNDESGESHGPVSPDSIVVKINNPHFKDLIVKELKKKNINFIISDHVSTGRSLDIRVERRRQIPFTQCDVQVVYSVKTSTTSMTMSSKQLKPVLGWGKMACKSIVKKNLKEIF